MKKQRDIVKQSAGRRMVRDKSKVNCPAQAKRGLERATIQRSE
jgi:hypothetical protein